MPGWLVGDVFADPFGGIVRPYRIADRLRTETAGGLLLLVAAAIALVWANSPWGDAYFDLAAIHVGPASWHLDLTLAAWAADGLLALFFFVAGLELCANAWRATCGIRGVPRFRWRPQWAAWPCRPGSTPRST